MGCLASGRHGESQTNKSAKCETGSTQYLSLYIYIYILFVYYKTSSQYSVLPVVEITYHIDKISAGYLIG